MRCADVFAIMVVVALGPAPARDGADHPIDDKTAEVMKKLGATYKDAKSLQCQATIETTVARGEDPPRKIDMRATLMWQRPNLFRLRSDDVKVKGSGLDVVSDGTNLYAQNRAPKEFIERKAPGKFSPIGLMLLDIGSESTGMLFQNLLSDDSAETLLEGITEGRHVGMEKVGGKECHHLRFMQMGNLWELWVAAEGDAYVLKMKSIGEMPAHTKQETTETYTNWKRNFEPAKDAFKFTPTAGATKVEHFSGRRAAAKDEDN